MRCETEGRLAIPGGSIWYGIVGKERPRPPLVTVHGGPGACCDYLESLAALAEERPVVFYDQLGCGVSDRPADGHAYTVDASRAELLLLLDALPWTRLHLLGQSWGAVPVAESLLTDRNGRILSATLSGPMLSAPRWGDDARELVAALDEPARAAIAAAEESGCHDTPEFEAAMQQFCERHLCRIQPLPPCVEQTFGNLNTAIYHGMWGASEFSITGTLRDYDLTPRLGEIRLPVLYTCGEYDEATPRTVAFYRDRTPGAQLRVFAGASHMHHLEAEEAFNAELRGFLARHDPS